MEEKKIKWRRIKKIGSKIKHFFIYLGRKFKKTAKNIDKTSSIIAFGLYHGAKALLFNPNGKRVADYVYSQKKCLCGKLIDIDMYIEHVTNDCETYRDINEKINNAKNVIHTAEEKTKQLRENAISMIEKLTETKHMDIEDFNFRYDLLRDAQLLTNKNVKKVIEKERKKKEEQEELKNKHGLRKIFAMSKKGLSSLQILVNVVIKISLTLIVALIMYHLGLT